MQQIPLPQPFAVNCALQVLLVGLVEGVKEDFLEFGLHDVFQVATCRVCMQH